jgi:hypothetical protein
MAEMAKKVTKTADPAAKKTAARADKADSEAALLAKIAAMSTPYSTMGKRVHALILRSAPALQPTPEEGAPHQLVESAWYFTALDDATEATLSAIVRKVAN